MVIPGGARDPLLHGCVKLKNKNETLDDQNQSAHA
jgi:hypothetical protein